MSNIINQNLDEIISIKNQLSNVLIENGIEAGNRFSDYPDLFRSAISSGSGFDPEQYYTADEIDENFVSKTELDSLGYITAEDVDMSDYLPLTGGEVTGPLYVSRPDAGNGTYGFCSYTHIVAGTQDKTTVSFLASKRKCGGNEGSSYMSAFFVNSDGRSKFTHKSYTNKADIGLESDDAFMCFNAYGFKVAFSGTAGVGASTEYDVLHTGNIGSLGYATIAYVNTVLGDIETLLSNI